MNQKTTNENTDRIKVIIRVRPKIEREYDQNSNWIKIEGNSILIQSKKESKQFTFDYIGNEDTSQSEIFNASAKDICDSVLEGYNGTIFVYGQTGAGKSYTLLGPKFFLSGNNFFTGTSGNRDTFGTSSIHESPIINRGYLTFTQKKEEEGRGILPRAIDYLFTQAKEAVLKDSMKTINFTCSFLEIYQEQISDLLDHSSDKQVLIRDLSDTVYIENLTKWKIKSPEEAYALIIKGTNIRHIATTAMNKESSRSHAVFSIHIETQSKQFNGKSKFTRSVFHLIDLAGSERQQTTECVGERIKEAGKINKSLMQLSHVIKNLSDNMTSKPKQHIHYRDSKLTHLLKDSLGGNAKTSIIANISPANGNIKETISTLLFSQSAKIIKNKAIINEEVSSSVNFPFSQLQEEIQRYKDKCHILKLENHYLTNLEEQNKTSPIILNPEMFSKTIDCVEEDIENLCNTLTEKNDQIEALKNENEEFMENIQKVHIELSIKEKELFVSKDSLKLQKKKYDSINKNMKSLALINAYHTKEVASLNKEKEIKEKEHCDTIDKLSNEIEEKKTICEIRNDKLNEEQSILHQLNMTFEEIDSLKQMKLKDLEKINNIIKEKDEMIKKQEEIINSKLNDMENHHKSYEETYIIVQNHNSQIQSLKAKGNKTIMEYKGTIHTLQKEINELDKTISIMIHDENKLKENINSLLEAKNKLKINIDSNNQMILQLMEQKSTLIKEIGDIGGSLNNIKAQNIILEKELKTLTNNKNANNSKSSLLTQTKCENKRLQEAYYLMQKSYNTLSSNLESLFGNDTTKHQSAFIDLKELASTKKSKVNELNGILIDVTNQFKEAMNITSIDEAIGICPEDACNYYFEKFMKYTQGQYEEMIMYQTEIDKLDKQTIALQRQLTNNQISLIPDKKRISTISGPNHEQVEEKLVDTCQFKEKRMSNQIKLFKDEDKENNQNLLNQNDGHIINMENKILMNFQMKLNAEENNPSA